MSAVCSAVAALHINPQRTVTVVILPYQSAGSHTTKPPAVSACSPLALIPTPLPLSLSQKLAVLSAVPWDAVSRSTLPSPASILHLKIAKLFACELLKAPKCNSLTVPSRTSIHFLPSHSLATPISSL